MKINPLSTTFARALIELGSGEKQLDELIEHVRFFEGLLLENRDFRTFVESPAISARVKNDSLDRVFRGKLNDLVLNFIQLAVEKNRQSLFFEIFVECRRLYDEAVGRIHVEAITAVPLDEEHEKALTSTLGQKLKKTIELENKVRPEILGGLILRYGDLVADDSVRSGLKRISRQMTSQKVGSELVHEN